MKFLFLPPWWVWLCLIRTWLTLFFVFLRLFLGTFVIEDDIDDDEAIKIDLTIIATKGRGEKWWKSANPILAAKGFQPRLLRQTELTGSIPAQKKITIIITNKIITILIRSIIIIMSIITATNIITRKRITTIIISRVKELPPQLSPQTELPPIPS